MAIKIDMFLNRLTSIMESEGLNHSRLANKVGLSRNAISQFFNKKRCPSTEVLIKLADTFVVSLDYLVGRTDESDLKDIIRHEKYRELVTGFAELTAEDQDRLLVFLSNLLQTSLNPPK